MRFIPETTSDGSLSCRDSQTGELCHNRAGAYTEALEHYIRPSGLIETILRTGEARVLDACYGLGYNTWVLADAIVKSEALQSRSEPFTVTVSGVELSREVIGFLPRVLELPTFDLLKSKCAPFEHNIYYRTLQCTCDTKPMTIWVPGFHQANFPSSEPESNP